MTGPPCLISLSTYPAPFVARQNAECEMNNEAVIKLVEEVTIHSMRSYPTLYESERENTPKVLHKWVPISIAGANRALLLQSLAGLLHYKFGSREARSARVFAITIHECLSRLWYSLDNTHQRVLMRFYPGTIRPQLIIPAPRTNTQEALFLTTSDAAQKSGARHTPVQEMSLVKLPYELISYVVKNLDLEDVRSLSLVCRRFQFLMQESSIAKFILESKVAYSKEAISARVTRRFASELRRLVKRREAISSVSPYLVAIVAVAETWLFVNGILSYTNDRELRILDLHRSTKTEFIVDIRALLDEAIPESRPYRKYRFQLLYTAGDIVSCLYTHARPEQLSWLVVFNARQERVLTARFLDSAHKIFVRNDDRFLYYGTHSEFGRDGFRRWVIRGFDLWTGVWLAKKMYLENMVGSDIGSTICFEIFDGFFYGLSNLTAFEVDEVDWTSYYYCFRFPVDQPDTSTLELAPKENMWRREHAEGPIDDRWTFLKIVKDEASGRLKIIESRKEWIAGSSSARRCYYVKDVEFENRGREARQNNLYLAAETQSTNHAEKFGRHIRNPVVARDPRATHHGDDGSNTLMFTLSKSFIRAYFSECQTFIDLVDDPSDFYSNNTQRIRIRGSSRRLRPYEEREQELKQFPVAGKQQQVPHPSRSTQIAENAGNELYKHHEVVFWPPEPDPAHPDPALDDLYNIMNPPSQLGNVVGTWDERSLIYGTGGTAGGPQALVFVSFDPAISLAGVRSCPKFLASQDPSQVYENTTGDTCLRKVSDSSSGEGKGKGKARESDWRMTTPYPVDPAAFPEATRDGRDTSMPTPSPNQARSSGAGSERKPWSVEQTPMYQRIAPQFSYYFGL